MTGPSHHALYRSVLLFAAVAALGLRPVASRSLFDREASGA